jgi:transcription antitermination factor NusG
VLFPGYVFVRVRTAQEWSSIFITRGVRSVLGTRDRPSPVRRGVIEALQLAEAAGLNELMSAQELDARLADVKIGDEVRVEMAGVLGELKAIYCGDVDDDRCEILISMCGRDSRTKVSKARLSA